MLVRVRNNTGLWRVELNDTIASTATLQDVWNAIRASRPHVVCTQAMSFDPPCKSPIHEQQTLFEQGIRHGSMIYCGVDPTSTLDISTSASTSAATTPTATAEDSQEGGGGVSSRSRNVSMSTAKSVSAASMKRVIGADGMIKFVPVNDDTMSSKKQVDRGFRKGMLALRDMKMHWTCTLLYI
jgi:hypothetical protein